MTKRIGLDDTIPPPSKRRHTEDNGALDVILTHSSDLIKCLQALSSKNHDALLNLRKLSKTLLPSFQKLAGEEAAEPNNETVDTKNNSISNTPKSAAPPIPSFALVKPWTPAEIPASLPPLPKINSAILEKAAFTHQGTVKRKGDLSYDRLEWLGDAYVELISSSLIFQTFGGLPTGKCSQLRELLIRNANLGKYATHYRLFERAILPAELDPKSKAEVKAKPYEIEKVRGDLFEAYVAAVVLGDPVHGLSRVSEWLRALWSTTIADQIRSASRTPDLHVVKELSDQSAQAESDVPRLPPKVELSRLIGSKGAQLRYEDMPVKRKDKYNSKLDLFTVGVYLDGWGEKNKLLGVGSDLNKKEAGQKAAQQAMDNKRLMKTYQQKKDAFMAAFNEAAN
ncbi:Ribonuclease 3 [Colletotrichum trifolii]|uniref:Ribonuclease 3 n=1 Tax=Colletotrichum trifolii TaxID=5466 RepID=A0A4R8RRX3_COLTR|nr:Ribonuclease 3 [Colletotrichum trifolii]